MAQCQKSQEKAYIKRLHEDHANKTRHGVEEIFISIQERRKKKAVVSFIFVYNLSARNRSVYASLTLGLDLQCSLGRRVLDELDTLADVATEALVALGQQLLLVVVGARNDVDDLLGTLGLYSSHVSIRPFVTGHLGEGKHTPSSTGAEKNSQPVSFWMASPPSTPAR